MLASLGKLFKIEKKNLFFNDTQAPARGSNSLGIRDVESTRVILAGVESAAGRAGSGAPRLPPSGPRAREGAVRGVGGRSAVGGATGGREARPAGRGVFRLFLPREPRACRLSSSGEIKENASF